MDDKSTLEECTVTFSRGELQDCYTTDALKVIIVESRDADGQLHAPFDEPAVKVMSADGLETLRLFHYHHGKLHRLDKPAVWISSDNVFIIEQWYKNGLEHRDPNIGPSHLETYIPNGCRTIEEYRTRGELHRIDGPAETRRNVANIMFMETWCINGQPRESKSAPQCIVRDGETGEINDLYFYFDGQSHLVLPKFSSDDYEETPQLEP